MLYWFESHLWEYLESKYLNNGERGIDAVKEDLKLLLLALMDGDKFLEDRRKPNYQDWIENQVREAVFNSMVAYVAIFGPGVGSSDGSGKPKLMQLMEKWRDGIALIKPKGEEFTSRICGERPRSKDCNGESPRSGMASPECTNRVPR